MMTGVMSMCGCVVAEAGTEKHVEYFLGGKLVIVPIIVRI
jgi:hypothetical protein